MEQIFVHNFSFLPPNCSTYKYQLGVDLGFQAQNTEAADEIEPSQKVLQTNKPFVMKYHETHVLRHFRHDRA